jgi:hypothetical protein
MFNWFRKKADQALEFPDNGAAFAHACTLGYKPLIDAMIPALVEEEGGRGRDGERTFLIRLAGAYGAKEFWSCTLKEAQSYPRAGDLVGFRIVMIASDLPEHASLIGYIACRLERVFFAGKGWAVAQSYTPENIKRAIRL